MRASAPVFSICTRTAYTLLPKTCHFSIQTCSWKQEKENVNLCCYRGNSKYHYYGIRIIPGSSLHQLTEDGTSSAVRQQPSSQKRYKLLSGSSSSGSGGSQKIENQYEQNTNHSASSNHSGSSPQVRDQAQFKEATENCTLNTVCLNTVNFLRTEIVASVYKSCGRGNLAGFETGRLVTMTGLPSYHFAGMVYTPPHFHPTVCYTRILLISLMLVFLISAL